MTGAGLEILASLPITTVARAVEDLTTLPQPLLFYNRAQRVQASDDEITMREKTYVFAADIVAPDAKGAIRDAGQITFETTRIAKIKHGFGINERQALLLDRIEHGQASNAEVLTFESYVARNVRALVLGAQQRWETMLIGMLIDGYTYNRLGISVSGSWGMPSGLKVTPSTAWTTAASATPITDIITLKAYAQRTYGEIFNRITMSYAALQAVLATTEFRDTYKALNFKWDVASNVLNKLGADPLQFASVVGSMVGMTVEIYDGMYREYNEDGTIDTPTRFLPENVVMFTNSADDNGMSGWDMAQGVIMESVMGRMGGTSVIGGMPSVDFGPIAYACQADPALDPAGLVVWCVDRGAPRKHRPTCSAKITAWPS